MATSFTMTQTTQADKTITRSITNINPEASDGQIAALAQGLNALTTNRLDGVDRIDKSSVNLSETFKDITVSFQKYSDTNNAVSFSGSTITINSTTAASTQPTITASLSVQGQALNPSTMTLKAVLSNPHISIDSSNDGVSANTLNFYYIGGDSIITGNMTVTIPAGSVIVGTTKYYYNPMTITVAVV